MTKLKPLDLPTAKEAAERSAQMVADRIQEYEDRMLTPIRDAMAQGKREVMLPAPMPAATVQRLRALGYGVTNRQTGPNESGVEVMW